MVTREDDLNELAINVSATVAKARQLKLPASAYPASAYIVSMALVEVLEATKAAPKNRKHEAGDSMWRVWGGDEIRR
jgi:hypothetical protein